MKQLIGLVLVMLSFLVFIASIHYALIVQYGVYGPYSIVGLVIIDLLLVGFVLIAAGDSRP